MESTEAMGGRFLSFSNQGEVLLPWHPLLPLSVPAPDCRQPSPVLRVPCLPPAQGLLLHSSLLLTPVPCACSFPNKGVNMDHVGSKTHEIHEASDSLACPSDMGQCCVALQLLRSAAKAKPLASLEPEIHRP